MDPTGRECSEAPSLHCAVTTYRVGQETVGVDDNLPHAAEEQAGEDSWHWVTSNPAPFSGRQAHRSALAPGMHQHFFDNAKATLPVADGDDRLFAYVYLDPANPPTEVMLQWNAGEGQVGLAVGVVVGRDADQPAEPERPARRRPVGVGVVVDRSVGSQMMLVDGDGTRRPFKWDRLERLVFSPNPVVDRNHYHTTDGSLIDYSVDTVQGVGFIRGQAKHPNGTVVDFTVKGRQPPDDPLRHHVLHASRITDANGNRISITYRDNTGPAIDTITDTLGRTIAFRYDANGLLTAIVGPGLSGGSRPLIQLHYGPRQIPGALTDQCCLFAALGQQVRDPATGVLTNGTVTLSLIDAIISPSTRERARAVSCR